MEQQVDLNKDLATLQQAVAEALASAKTRGAGAAEVAISRQTGNSVSTRLKEVENVEFNRDGALGITVYFGARKGSSSTSDLSSAAIGRAVEAACDIAQHTSEDPCSGLADKALMAEDYPDLDLCHPADLSVEKAAELAAACETTGLEHDARIVNSDGASYTSHVGVRVYGNSHGFIGGYTSSRHSLSCVLIGREDEQMQRDYSYSITRHPDDLWTPQQVGLEAAERTVSRLGGRKVPTCEVPVLFAPDAATSLFGHLVSAISGANLYREASFLLDSLGKSILPAGFVIEEDPHLKRGLASSPFDAEGVKTTARRIIDDGVLTTYLLTSYAARKLNMTATGHAGGIHNWSVKTSDLDQAALLRQMGTGLLITELMGQGVNTVTGDYSRGAAGFWVENGVLAYPVEEITVAGNLKQMLQDIVAVGNDVDLRNSVRTGSVLIEKMKVAGH